MDFIAAVIDPTDTSADRIEVFCSVVAWQVNHETKTVEFKVRCWRSAAAKNTGRQPLFNTQVSFMQLDLGNAIIQFVLAAKWHEVGVQLKERIELQFGMPQIRA